MQAEHNITPENLCGIESGHILTPYSADSILHGILTKLRPTLKVYLAVILHGTTVLFQAEKAMNKQVLELNKWKDIYKQNLNIRKYND